VSGTYVARASLQLTIGENGGSETVSAAYDSGYDQPASVAAVAGLYKGSTGHSYGKLNASVSFDANGNFFGVNDACSFQGTITPHKSANVFDFVVSGPSGNCIFAKAMLHGILYYDPDTKQIHGLAPYVARNHAWYLIGTRQ
jgi:hypothetical protein